MAKQSTLKTMRAISIFLVAAVAGLMTAGAVKIGHHYPLTGTELIGWALVSLAALLGFFLPVRCRVKRTNSKACGNWSYGLLFGCGKVPGHRWGKFSVRLRLNRGEVKPVARRPPPAGTVVLSQPAPQPKQSPSVSVDEGLLAKCGFWVGLVSGLIGIIQAVAAYTH
jgi:hypothetical protein